MHMLNEIIKKISTSESEAELRAHMCTHIHNWFWHLGEEITPIFTKFFRNVVALNTTW